MAKKVGRQSVESQVTNIAEALAYVGQVSPPKLPKSLILAKNDPKTVQGYEKLGTGGPPHTGKALSEKSKDNRGEGSM